MFAPGDDFFLEAFFWYPPLTMLLVGPLGWFEPSTATAIWYLGHGLALLGSAFLLARLSWHRGVCLPSSSPWR